MTPPLVTRDALEGFIDQGLAVLTERGVKASRSDVGCVLDALLASGILRDPASLADDEALVDALMCSWYCPDDDGDAYDAPDDDGDAYDAARRDLRALAAALTEDPS